MNYLINSFKLSILTAVVITIASVSVSAQLAIENVKKNNDQNVLSVTVKNSSSRPIDKLVVKVYAITPAISQYCAPIEFSYLLRSVVEDIPKNYYPQPKYKMTSQDLLAEWDFLPNAWATETKSVELAATSSSEVKFQLPDKVDIEKSKWFKAYGAKILSLYQPYWGVKHKLVDWHYCPFVARTIWSTFDQSAFYIVAQPEYRGTPPANQPKAELFVPGVIKFEPYIESGNGSPAVRPSE